MSEYSSEDLENKLQAVVKWLHNEYKTIRTGQANPALLDAVKVDSYGTLLTITQVSNVSVEDARTLRVIPWDTSQISEIEQSILKSDLGVSVTVDDAGLRVIFPELTSERRVSLLKLSKNKLEESRVSVRAIRDDFMKIIDNMAKHGEISEDEKFSLRDEVQDKIDNLNKILEGVFSDKEKELSV